MRVIGLIAAVVVILFANRSASPSADRDKLPKFKVTYSAMLDFRYVEVQGLIVEIAWMPPSSRTS
jgi:hypothetical protein